MARNLALPIQSDTQTFSVPELRQRTVSRMHGDEMAEWDFSTKPINVVCTGNGSGYLKGHFYVTTNDGLVYDTFRMHNHSGEREGGSKYDLEFVSSGTFIDWNKSAGVSPADFTIITQLNSTLLAEMTSSQLYSKFQTGGTANDYVNGIVGGGRIYYGRPYTQQVKYTFSHNDNALLKIGTGFTTIENAAGTDSQMGFEHCSGASDNIGVVSADGIARQTDYIMNVVQPVSMGLRLDYYPSAKIIARNGDGVSVTHTSNLPSVNDESTSANEFRIGVKTLSGTPKNLKLFMARFYGTSYDIITQAWV